MSFASSSATVTGKCLEEVVRQMPAAVAIVEAESGRFLHTNARAQVLAERLGQPMPEGLSGGIAIYHLDGRRYRPEEWPITRSISSGEHVTDEEYFHALPGGDRLFVRASSSPVFDDQGRILAGVVVMEDVTQQRRAAEQLAYHASLVDNMEDAVVATDTEFRVTAWNRGAELLYGFTAEEVLGRDAREIECFRSIESRLEIERELSGTGRSRVELTARRKDGAPVEVELGAVAVRDRRGSITGYIGMHRDVTERKQAEAMLAESQTGVMTILESITDAFYAMDRDWRFTYLNDRAVQVGSQLAREQLTLDDLLGRTLWETLPATAGTELEERFRHALNAQETAAFEYEYPGGGPIFDVRAYPYEWGLSIYFQDITDKRRAERELESRAQRQALLAELGQRALARDDLALVMDEAVEMVARALDVELAAVAEILPPGGEELVLRAGVGWRPETMGSGMGSAGRGSLVGYTVMTGEPVVSEDLKAEDRFTITPLLAERHPRSAACVVIAGRERLYGALGAFAKEQRAFSEDDVNFLQSVANVISAAVERVNAEVRVAEVRETERRRIARDLHDEALQDLTDALALATTGQTAGLAPALRRAGQQLRSAIYDLRLGAQEDRPFTELLEDLVELQRALAGDCEIVLEVADGVPQRPLGTRGTELLRVVGEALINARRHSGARNVRVVVSAAELRLCAEVADDGHGFDIAGSSARGSGLRGMGERAALLDGKLDIESRPGSGTVVRIEAPLGDPHRPARAKARVLLVEDHTAVREAIGGMFDREPDFEVVAQASSLAEARELLNDIDIALVDLGLPDGYGGDLIKELRETNPGAQALVLSANLDHADIARAVQSGAAGTLNKTVHLDEVVDSVRRLRAGETLLPMEEVVALLRYAGDRGEAERQDRASIERLTRREREVLQGMAEGLNSQATADRLHITLRTERNHVSNILSKLGLHSQLQALVFAPRYGVVEIR